MIWKQMVMTFSVRLPPIPEVARDFAHFLLIALQTTIFKKPSNIQPMLIKRLSASARAGLPFTYRLSFNTVYVEHHSSLSLLNPIFFFFVSGAMTSRQVVANCDHLILIEEIISQSEQENHTSPLCP